MAIMVGKGTALQESIASVYTAIGQIISIDLPECENETFEADYLDNTVAGIPYQASNRSEGGSVGFEIFYDPALASHRKITDKIINPVTTGTNVKVVYSTTTNTVIMSVAGFGIGGTVALNDGVKATCSGKLSGVPAFTTTT